MPPDCSLDGASMDHSSYALALSPSTRKSYSQSQFRFVSPELRAAALAHDEHTADAIALSFPHVPVAAADTAFTA